MVQIIDHEGKVFTCKKIEKTFPQWAEALTNTIIGIKKDRIEGILQRLYDKGFIVEAPKTGNIYRRTAPLRRCPIVL